MLSVHVCQSPIGLLHRETFSVPFGSSFRELCDAYRDEAWSEDAPILVATVHGRVENLDEYPLDGAHVVIAPDPGVLEILVTVLINVLISVAISWAIGKLTGPDVVDIKIDDERSPTYGFKGVRTTYGIGFRVPIAYGYHGLGGHAVSTDVSPINPAHNAETLKSRLVLSEGPIHAIGGVSRDVDLAVPGTTTSPNTDFPQGIRVNGVLLEGDDVTALNEGTVRVSTRLGNVFQSPIVGFEEPRIVVAVDAVLEDEGSSHVVAITGTDSDTARVQIDFPNGLYRDTGGGISPVDPAGPDAQFRVQFRPTPVPWDWSVAWNQIVTVDTGALGAREPFSSFLDLPVNFYVDQNPAGTFDGVEIRVERLTPRHANTAQEVFIEDAVFRRIVHGPEEAYSHPKRAQVGILQRGTERFQGNRPNYLIPSECRTVRVWDSVEGLSSAEYWDLPEAGDDYAGIWTYPPGRNPAWVAADMLTNRYGLAPYIAAPGTDIDTYIDWPAFRNLADYCDQTVEGAAFHQCDYVFDRGVEGWEAVMAILRTCRAIPMRAGRVITVRYQYRDAHGRGGNSVPARIMVAMVGTSSVENFSMSYLPKFEAPNVLVGSFLNEAKNWEPDEIPQEDIESGLDDTTNPLVDQVRSSPVRMFGITSARRIERELDFMHQINRLATKTVSFTAGIEQLAIEPYDLIGVQHDSFRPFSSGAAWVSARTKFAYAADVKIHFTREIEIPVADVDYKGTFVATDGTVTTVDLTPPVGVTTVVVGATWDTSAGVTCPQGAVFTIGGQTDAETIEQFVVTSIALTDAHKLQIEALEWTPDAYDSNLPAEIASAEIGITPPYPLKVQDPLPQIDDVRVEKIVGRGMYRILWQVSQGLGTRPSQVFGRKYCPEPDRPASGHRFGYQPAPRLLGTGVGFIDVSGLAPDIELWVSPELGEAGVFAGPIGAGVRVQTPEFRQVKSPANVQNFTAGNDGEGIHFTWDPVISEDLAFYELRRGSRWEGATVLGRTTEPRLFWWYPAAGVSDYMVRAIYIDGVPSPKVSRIATYTWVGTAPGTIKTDPFCALFLIQHTDPAPSWSGTKTNVSVVDSEVVISTGKHEGSYVQATADLGDTTPALWVVDVDTRQDHLELVGSDPRVWQNMIGGSVACKRAMPCDPTPTSYRNPAPDLEVTGSDVESIGTRQTHIVGRRGTAGAWSDTKIEIRHDLTGAGAWSAWHEYSRGGVKTRAARCEVRVTIRRSALRFQRILEGLRISVFG